MKKTAVSAPAPEPKPTIKEMLDTIDKMSWEELDDFTWRIQKIQDKHRDKKLKERFDKSEY